MRKESAMPLETATTALREAEAALARAIERERQIEEEYGRTIAEVVHDINNPLSAMLATITALKGTITTQPEQARNADYIRILDQSTRRLASICEVLLGRTGGEKRELEAPSLESQASDGEPQDVDAGQMITEIVGLFDAVARQRGIGLKANVSDDFPKLHTTPRHLYRTLTNLVSNAVKFTPRGGMVVVEAYVDDRDDAVIMVVRDTGKGIPPDQILRVLRPFGTTPPPREEGASLGLPIVSRLVHEMGGTMQISSTDGTGTSVTVRFPKSIMVRRR